MRGIALDRSTARRLVALLRRMEARPVNDPPEDPDFTPESSYCVRVIVADEPAVDGLKRCTWSYYVHGLGWVNGSNSTAWAIGVDGGTSAAGGHLALLTATHPDDGLPIFATSRAFAISPTGAGNTITVVTQADFTNCTGTGQTYSAYVDISGTHFPVTFVTEL